MASDKKITFTINEGIPEVSPETTQSNLGVYRIIDVRRPEEFIGELGHIEGAELVTLGPDLANFLSDLNPASRIIFICRSGARSAQATVMSRQLGCTETYNMAGGMLAWRERQLPVKH